MVETSLAGQEQQRATVQVPNQNPVVSSNEDVVGYIALANILLTTRKQLVSDAIASLSPDLIEIYRNSALKDIINYTKKDISRNIDEIRSEVIARTHHEVMRDNFTFLLKDQQVNFDNVVLEINKSGSAFRQIVIAVISAFVFGLIISGAAILANPFADVIKAWRGH